MNLAPLAVQKFFDNAGRPLNGGLLFTYVVGTSTKLATYQDQAGTQNTNPVVLNFRGEANVWLDQTLTYKFVLAPANDTDPPTSPIWSVDNVSAGITFASLTAQIIGQILYPRTLAEIAASVTPINYQYSPDHIGDDVRRYGNIDLTGGTDCRAVLNTANSVGNSLYFPKGTYRVSSNLTLSVACFFDYGAILKPDAGVVISFTHAIVAGPWQIFDVSNTPTTGASSIQNGVAPIAGLAKIPIVAAEWFGAIGDGVTSDYKPLQAALNFCMAANFIPLQLLARTYYTDKTLYGAGTPTTRTLGTVSIYGISGTGTALSILTDNGVLAHATALLQYRNTSSNNTHGEVSGIYFTSDTGGDAIGIEFNGTCQFRVTRCKFGTLSTGLNTLLEGIRFDNDSVGIYTEFCIASNCEFYCDIVLDYVGNGSYHGSGLDSQCTATLAAGGALVIINAGAQPYNSPLDVAVWTTGVTTLIVSNNTTASCSFFGRLGLEVAGGTCTLGGGQIINFAGPFACNSTAIVSGTFVYGQRLIQNAGTNTLIDGGTGNFVQAITTGANTLASHPSLYAQARMVYIRLVQGAPAYDYRYLIALSPLGGTVATVATLDTLNTAGYGAPAFSLNAGGQLIATNAGYPASGITAYYRDVCVDSLGIQV